MKILVTGAGGFLGRHVVERLLDRGHSVRATIRVASPEPKWSREVELFRADLRTHSNLAAAFEGIEAVIHLAAATSGGEDTQFASTVVATERLLDAMARSSTRRLVLVSSLVVYDWSKAASLMDEQTPLLKDAFEMGAYTIAKVWQERVVSKCASANGWELTIMRPGFIWGPQRAEIAGMGRHFGRVHVIFGPFTRLPLSHVVNCADCLVAATENHAAIGQTFNVIDSDEIRVWRYVKEYAKRTSRRGWLIPVPYYIGLGIAKLALLTSRVLFGRKGKLPSLLTPNRFESQFKPIRFRSDKLRDVLGWKPPLNFEECVNHTYRPLK
jgi:nucleoside-diphosphate-sugar epimerase